VGDLDRTRSDRQPFVIWFTGVSGAGKSTIASVVEKRLRTKGVPVYNLDGDIIRLGLNSDLGFTDADRIENIRRIGEVTRLFVSAGTTIIVAAISPFREGRKMARSLFTPGKFVEVHIDIPIAVAEQRDTKGLYRLARQGRLPNFTGIDSLYELPIDPEVRIDSANTSPEEAANEIIHYLQRINLIEG
jgi:bifunctional enzyme CysN/CysC